MSEDDTEMKARASSQGVKFSEFEEIQPDATKELQMVGLREGKNVRAKLTTDLVSTNTAVIFRDQKGRFRSTAEIPALDNQLQVNRFLWEEIEYRTVVISIEPPSPVGARDGMLWFDNNENSMQLYIYHADSNAWIPVAPPASISDRVAKGEETQAGLVEAVGELEHKVTALEGAVGEHSLVFNPDRTTPRAGEFVTKDAGNQVVNTLSAASIIHISVEDRDGNSIAVDRITEGDVMRLSDISGVTAEVKIKNNLGGGAYEMEKLFGDLDRLSEYPYDFNLFSSFDPAGLATKDYVDARDKTKIGRRAIWTLENDTPWELRQYDSQNIQRSFIKIHDGRMDLRYIPQPTESEHAANKSYVDQSIAAAIANIMAQQSPPRPAQLSWKWAGESSNAPGTGRFCKNGNRWKFSKKTHNGLEISLPDTKHWGTSQLVEMSVWRTDGDPNKWRMVKHLEIDEVDWAKEYGGNVWIEFHQKWESNTLKLNDGREYFVTIGGFF